MENEKTNVNTGNNEKILTVKWQESKYLDESRKWAMFLAVIGFISCGIMVIAALFIMVVFSLYPVSSSMSFTESIIIGIFYTVLAVLYFFPCFFLYRFACNMGKALKNKDQSSFTSSLRDQRLMFRFIGIMTIVLITLYILIIIGAIIFGVVFASSII